MGSKTAFRLLVMIACLAGVAYGASQIGQLPTGPRKAVARIGKWLQARADVTNTRPPPAVATRPTPPVVETDHLTQDSGFVSNVAVPIGEGDVPVGENRAPAEPQQLGGSVALGGQQLGGSLALPGKISRGHPGRTDRGDSALETMASRLRELGATDYQLEKWGADGRLFRFTCKVAVVGEAGLHQHFEAVADSSANAIGRVIDHVVRSQNLPPHFDR